MSRFDLDLRGRRGMLALGAAALVVVLALASVLLMNPKPAAGPAGVTALQSATVRPSPSPEDRAVAAILTARITATSIPSATPGPTATSLVVSFATRSAAATAQAAAGSVPSGGAPSGETPPPPSMEAGGTASPRPTAAFIPIDQLPSPTPTPIFPGQLAGKILFRSAMDAGVTRTYLLDPDGSGLALVTADWPLPRATERDGWSPDRFYRVAVGRNLDTGQVRLEVRDGASDLPVAVIASGAVSAPAWSPVSDQVAFVSTEGGNEDIWIVNADGRGKKQLTANKWAADQHPSWSPDGKQIVFTSNRNGKRQLWIINVDGSGARMVSGEDYEAWDPVWVKYDD